jgi:membrane protease YdiL (CAAX protease family)
MRATPKPLTAVLVFLGYLVVFYGVWIATGIDYDRIGDNADTLLKWYVAPLAAGAVFLIIAVSVMGWWRPALFEVAKAQPRWLLIGPILMFLAAVLFAATSDRSDTTARMALLVLIGSIGVGFCEELASRGVLIVGFRGAYAEAKVWFLSCLLFGLLHLPNWLFGAGPGALSQVLLAFTVGSMLYVTRRVTGSLLWCMLLHGLWDFSQFIGDSAPATSLVAFLIGILALVFAWVLLRREKGQRIPQLGVDAPTPVAA